MEPTSPYRTSKNIISNSPFLPLKVIKKLGIFYVVRATIYEVIITAGHTRQLSTVRLIPYMTISEESRPVPYIRLSRIYRKPLP